MGRSDLSPLIAFSKTDAGLARLTEIAARFQMPSGRKWSDLFPDEVKRLMFYGVEGNALPEKAREMWSEEEVDQRVEELAL